MEVVIVSSDALFITAVEGLAGAMGHTTRSEASAGGPVPGGLFVVDGAVPGFERVLEAAGEALMRTAARGTGAARFYPRRALAQELPRLLREYGAPT